MNEMKAEVRLITPCFCAGADQQQAEIRVPSIRGQLRWWFRVLGGSPAAEREVFGGISRQGEEEKPAASRVCLRISEIMNQYGEAQDLPGGTNSPLGYLFYYAKVSGNRENIYRFQKPGWLAPGSRFTLHASFRRPLADVERERFVRSWQAFLALGSLGLRQTRGMGALAVKELQTFAEFEEACRKMWPGIKKWYVTNSRQEPFFCSNWKEALISLEAALGWIRQHGFSAGQYGENPTPLGKSKGKRQASALHLRPILLQEGILPVLFYTPEILAPDSQNLGFENLLDKMTFKTPYQQRKAGDGADGRAELCLCVLK